MSTQIYLCPIDQCNINIHNLSWNTIATFVFCAHGHALPES